MSRIMVDERAEEIEFTQTETQPVIPAPDTAGREPVVLRRHASLSAVIGLAATLLSGLYLWRAVDQGGAVPLVVGLVLAGLAAFHLAQWVDARTPLLVADATGVRIRLGNAWHGLLWDDVDRISVRERRGLFRDGRVVVHPVEEDALRGLGGRTARRLAANAKVYGAPFALPLGMTTVASTDDLAGALERLAGADTPVQVTAPAPSRAADGARSEPADGSQEPRDEGRAQEPEPEPESESESERPGPEPEQAPARAPQGSEDQMTEPQPSPGPGPTREPDPEPMPNPGPPPEPRPEPEPEPEPQPERERAVAHEPSPAAEPESVEPERVRPVRPIRRARRSDVARPPTVRAPVQGQLALQEPLRHDPDTSTEHGSDATGTTTAKGPRARGNMSLVLGETPAPRPVPDARTTEGDDADPAVFDDLPTPAPVADPVIGPEVVEARTVLRMSVDDLAARTRIRPHVLEAIEVDDFDPCAGDFYARGHLRAIGRALGIDPEPLVARYEERYATDPVSPLRVFEAELAAGDSGAFRGLGAHGAPRWGGLLATVAVLVLVWALVGLFLA